MMATEVKQRLVVPPMSSKSLPKEFTLHDAPASEEEQNRTGEAAPDSTNVRAVTGGADRRYKKLASTPAARAPPHDENASANTVNQGKASGDTAPPGAGSGGAPAGAAPKALLPPPPKPLQDLRAATSFTKLPPSAFSNRIDAETPETAQYWDSHLGGVGCSSPGRSAPQLPSGSQCGAALAHMAPLSLACVSEDDYCWSSASGKTYDEIKHYDDSTQKSGQQKSKGLSRRLKAWLCRRSYGM